MITIKTMKQIATSQVIRGGRSLPSLSRISSASLDRARIVVGFERVSFQRSRRQWLNQSYLNQRQG